MKRLVLLIALLLAFPAHAQKFQADSNINVTSVIVANNATPIVIRAGTATVYGIEASNNSTAIAYVKLYNATSLTACGTGTPFARYMIPKEASASLQNATNVNGDAYVTGVVMCIVTGIADNDATAPAATTYTVNVHWKQGQP